jgi:hypothetical protein
MGENYEKSYSGEERMGDLLSAYFVQLMKTFHIFSLTAPLLVTFGQFSNALLILMFNLEKVMD